MALISIVTQYTFCTLKLITVKPALQGTSI